MGYIIHTNQDDSEELTVDSDIEEIVGKDAEEYVRSIYEEDENREANWKDLLKEIVKFLFGRKDV